MGSTTNIARLQAILYRSKLLIGAVWSE